MTSQQGNVDWFCFWIKGEEDPDPAKAEQYKRWRELRSLRKLRMPSAILGEPNSLAARFYSSRSYAGWMCH